MSDGLLSLIDDPDIGDDVIVFRRGVWDQVGGQGSTPTGVQAKISGNFFSDRPAHVAAEYGFGGACMSVGLGSVLSARELPVRVLLGQMTGCGLLAMRVGDLRQLKRGSGEACPQGIMAAPTESEPWHAVVFDMTQPPRNNSAKKAMTKIARWEVPLIG